MSNFQLACIAVAAFCFFIIRLRWIVWKLEDYRLKVLWFCVATKQKKEILQDMSQLWPITIMAFQLWNWNFRKYVVDQEKYDEMIEFLDNHGDQIILDKESD